MKVHLNKREIMPRITVKVDVPTSPDDLADLIGKIIAQDTAMNASSPGSSPLNPKDVTALKAIQASVQPDRALIKNLQPQIDAAVQRSETNLGLANGQTVRTEGTGLFLVTKLRDVLLAEYKGQEKQMEGFGYNVAMGSAATPQRAAKTDAKKTA
jgi:hypothetical protein